MTFLLLQIFSCLLAAFLIGAVATWLVRRSIERRRSAIIQSDWRERVRQVEVDRERTVRRLSAEIDALKGRESQAVPPDTGAGGEYETLISALEERVAEREEAIGELRREIQSLREQLAGADERESALRDEQQAEITALREALAERDRAGSGADDPRIRELEEAVRQRDDSIAVLRDDLAELAGQRHLEQRGRQDEELRAAMDDAIAWQEKYETAAAELADREKQLTEMRQGPGNAVARASTKSGAPRARPQSGRSRSAGDRIASLLAGSPVPRDDLQKIRGIGPVLEKMLNELGIHRYQQIAEFDTEDVERIAREIGRFGKRIENDNWVEQAKALYREKKE